MRRALKSLGNLAHRGFAEAESGWDRFWYTPADPTVLGMVRILTGLMLIYTHAVWGLQLEAFFGPDSWLTREVVETAQRDQVAWTYWWHVPVEWIWPAHYAALAILTLFTLGIATRATSVLAFIVVVSYVNRVPCALFGLDQINSFLTLYCAIGPSGAALSVDRLVERYRTARRSLAAGATSFAFPPQPSVAANVALRLIQIQMCVIYFFAAISKLQGTAWWNGGAMWLAFSNYEYQSMDMTWLANHLWIVELMTHVTIAWEITFWALVWRPFWRPIVLFGAVALHIGIGLCLGMWTFGLIMIVANFAFLKPSEVTAALRWVSSLWARPAVEYDASRPASVRWASLCVALDPAEEATAVLRSDPTGAQPAADSGPTPQLALPEGIRTSPG